MHASEFTDRGEHAYGGMHANVGSTITSYDCDISGRSLEKTSSGYTTYGYTTYDYSLPPTATPTATPSLAMPTASYAEVTATGLTSFLPIRLPEPYMGTCQLTICNACPVYKLNYGFYCEK